MTAAGIACASGGTVGTSFFWTLAAGFPAGAAGNLFTDVFKDFDRAAGERWFDRFSGIDVNHTVLEHLRLAHMTALRAVVDEFDRQRGADGEASRAETWAGDGVSGRLGKLCLEEEKEVRLVRFGLRSTTAADERRVRTAVLGALPDRFDAALAARRQDGAPPTDAAIQASLRQGIEDAVLAELRFLLEAGAGRGWDGVRGLPAWMVAALEWLAPRSGRDGGPVALPPAFESIFRGEPGVSKGWFDGFVLEAARRLREVPGFAAIWQGEQLSAVKALVAAQGRQLGDIAERIGGLSAQLIALASGMERIGRGVEEIAEWLAGVELRTEYRDLAADQVARLPTALVVADYGVVRYDDARGLLGAVGDGPDTLLGWASRGGGTRVRLYVAPGGQGKTRLALEAITRLNEPGLGWRAGLMTHMALERALERAPGSPGTPLARMLARRGTSSVFIAIDYAETRFAQLVALAKVLEEAPAASAIRVVLIARTDGWWRGFLGELRNSQEVLFEAKPIDLAAEEMAEADRQRFFGEACASFAGRLAGADAEGGAEGGLLAAGWEARPVDPSMVRTGNPLALTMLAYLHVRGRGGGEGNSAKSPLAEMAEEERFHIARALRLETGQEPSKGLVGLGFASAAAVTLMWGFSAAKGEAALHEVIGEMAAEERLHPAGSLAADRARGAVRAAVRRLYGAGKEEVRPILPDLLGEQAVGEMLRGAPGVLGRLLLVFPEDTTRMLIVLNRITRRTRDGGAVHEEEAVVAPTRAALRPVLEARLVEGGFAEALMLAALADEGVIQEDARSVMNALPAVAQGAAGAAVRMAGSRFVDVNAPPVRLRGFLGDAAHWDQGAGPFARPVGDGIAARAAAAEGRSVWLSNAGRRDEALATTEEALTLYHKLMTKNRDAFLPHVARVLNNLGNRLSEVGRRQEAAIASERAVTLYRELVGKHRDAFMPALAMALCNLGARYSDIARLELALSVSEEGAVLYRELTCKDRNAFLPDLATALNNVGNRLCEIGRSRQGLAASEEAVTLRRELVGRNRDMFLPDLATALLNLGLGLYENGQRKDALTISEEAVSLYRELVGKTRDAFLPELAGALSNYGNRLSEFGLRKEGVSASEEAVILNRELVGKDRYAFLPNLAAGLTNLGERLSQVGLHDRALAAGEEAITYYQELVVQDYDAFLPNYAGALANLGMRLSEVGRTAQALAVSQEAVTLYKGLAGKNRDAYVSKFAMALASLAIRLSQLGRHKEALTVGGKAVLLYRELVDQNRDAFLPDLASGLNSLGSELFEVGRMEEALRASEEAVTLHRELVDENRDAFLPDLARSLGRLGKICLHTGRIDTAVDALHEGASAVRPLAEADLAAFGALFRALVGELVRGLQVAGRDGDVSGVLAALGVVESVSGVGGSAGFEEAVRLVGAWVAALNEAGGSAEGGGRVGAARQALAVHMEAFDGDVGLDPVRGEIARIEGLIAGRRGGG